MTEDMTKRTLAATIVFALTMTAAMAVPAKHGLWRTLRLVDGTEVRAQRMGDERTRFWMSDNGLRLTLTDQGAALVLTRKVMSERLAKRTIRKSQTQGMLRPPRRVAPGERTSYLGRKRGLVILVEYADVKFKAANTLAKYKRILNEAGYKTSEGFQGSVADYFREQSEGQFEIEFDVVGPYTLKYNREYYGTNIGDDDQAAEEMIVEACLQADAEVDFKDYDWDGDGEADQVFVLYAGTGEADSFDDDAVWPHMYELSETDRQMWLDGVLVNTYACSNEVDMYGRIEGIGCFCHEFSHCMGFPDFYDINYEGHFGMSSFDLMDGGAYNADGFVPAGYSAYEKMMCGWREPVELKDSLAIVENLLPMSEGGTGYIIYNKAYPSEYYILENRQQTGWDAGLPANGLMITHVDFDPAIWEYNVPNTILDEDSEEVRKYGYPTNDHQRLTIFHADNDDDLKYWNPRGYYTKQTLTTDLYPYLGNDSLTNHSMPAATLYNKNTDGSLLMNVAITDIQQNEDGTMDFCFSMRGDAEPDGFKPIQDSRQAIRGEKTYDLSGKLMQSPLSKGIYIVNGKKNVVR